MSFLFLCFWSFGHEECGIIASQPGIESASPIEGEVLTAGPPGSPTAKSLNRVVRTHSAGKQVWAGSS